MNISELTKVNHKKDLGVTISNKLKSINYCSDIVKKANKLVCFIGRTFEYIPEKVILTLFNALEYCIQF